MATIAAPPRGAAKTQAAERYEGLVLDFLAHLEFERGLSRNTLAAYRTDLLQFGRFLAERERDATDAGASDLSDFLAELAKGDGNGRPPCSTATVHRKAACLRSFYRHLRREEAIEDDPAARLAVQMGLQEVARKLASEEDPMEKAAEIVLQVVAKEREHVRS